jgi:hypothetical protein
MPAVKRIVVVALASYFLSINKCPTTLKKCFESKQPFLYPIFLQNKLDMFNTCIKEFENENISPAEVKCIIDA